jgi:formylglycine-generating enzyme
MQQRKKYLFVVPFMLVLLTAAVLSVGVCYAWETEYIGDWYGSERDKRSFHIKCNNGSKKYVDHFSYNKYQPYYVDGRGYKTLEEAAMYACGERPEDIRRQMQQNQASERSRMKEELRNELRKEQQQQAVSDRRPAIIREIDANMVSVKGGCFQMGDTFGDGGSDEKPVHQVCVGSFKMSRYEVTQEQWLAVMGNNPSHFAECGLKCPVEKVSWDDIQDFLSRLNSATGKQYRLPTEAEWEYAARSGGKSEKWAGTSSESSLGQYAWYDPNSGEKTHPVGQKQPNGLGLYDMSGNVWEWCYDWYDENYYSSSPKQNPPGPTSAKYRVLRGGCWNDDASLARAANRLNDTPANRDNYSGFRVVLPAR